MLDPSLKLHIILPFKNLIHSCHRLSLLFSDEDRKAPLMIELLYHSLSCSEVLLVLLSMHVNGV